MIDKEREGEREREKRREKGKEEDIGEKEWEVDAALHWIVVEKEKDLEQPFYVIRDVTHMQTTIMAKKNESLSSCSFLGQHPTWYNSTL